MQYKCARAIKVERLDNDTIRKTYADYERKGLVAEQWQQEMQHEIAITKAAARIINAPHVLNVNDYHFDMTYCGEALGALTLTDCIKIKNMERDLIHKARIYHNDIKIENILRNDNNELYLIDYGRATLYEPAVPFYTHLNLVAHHHNTNSDEFVAYLDRRISALTATTTAHGGKQSYYKTRPWDDRWQLLRSVTDYSNKRILDLGCNQGMLCISIATEYKPAFALGVDATESIIKAAHYTAIKHRANAHFKHLTLAQGDKRNPTYSVNNAWKGELGTDFDIVFALSLYHWVENKEELLNYLSNFNTVILELHNDNELEEVIKHFRRRGYKTTILKIAGDTLYDRPLVRFSR